MVRIGCGELTFDVWIRGIGLRAHVDPLGTTSQMESSTYLAKFGIGSVCTRNVQKNLPGVSQTKSLRPSYGGDCLCIRSYRAIRCST